MTTHEKSAATMPTEMLGRATVARIEAALSGVRFGSVELIVHEGQVVQIIRTERMRVDRATYSGVTQVQGGCRRPKSESST